MLDILIFIGFISTIVLFVLALVQHLNKISKYLRIISLQLEIQNPMFVSEELMELDKHIEYWQEKMLKYKNDFNEKNKEIGGLTFNLFWAHVERLNHYRVMIAEAKQTGNPTKIHDKYRKWLEENFNRIDKLEKRAIEINDKIKDELNKRDLDVEFLGKWNTNEN